MSIPRNHHYVSKVLSRKFFDNTGVSYQYDKTNKYFSSIKSSKSLFSKNDLNSIISKNGEIDHSSVEENLNKSFESDFNKHYERIVALTNTNYQPLQNLHNPTEILESLRYIIRMGIIGEMRTPYHMLENEASVFGSLFMIAENATDELREAIRGFYLNCSKVTNKLPVDFKHIADEVMRLMGDITYSIHKAPPNSFFFLPDCSSSITRLQLEADTVLNGEVYLNPQRPIAMVLIPINSKILLCAHATKIYLGQSNGIYSLKEDVVNGFNNIILRSAYGRIICENETYLKDFIKNKIVNNSLLK